MPEQTIDAKTAVPKAEGLGNRIRHGFEAARRKFDKPPSEERKIDNFEQYIETGLEAIKQRDYQRAISVFSRPEAAEQVGLVYDSPETVFLTEAPQDEKHAHGIISNVGTHSWFEPAKNGGKGVIKTAHVGIAPPQWRKDNSPIILSPTMNELIFHNVALLNAEEWIHALRFKRGIDIPSDSATGSSDVDEAQVALYMLQKGVPLTERFLTQYGRRDQLRALGYQV
jgi:hypothetical protein